MCLTEPVTRIKCNLCGGTYIRQEEADVCAARCQEKRASAALDVGKPLREIEDDGDHEENNPPVTGDGIHIPHESNCQFHDNTLVGTGDGPHLERFPDEQPKVDPVECFEEAMATARGVARSLPTAQSIPLGRALVLIRASVTSMGMFDAESSRIDIDLVRAQTLVEKARTP